MLREHRFGDHAGRHLVKTSCNQLVHSILEGVLQNALKGTLLLLESLLQQEASPDLAKLHWASSLCWLRAAGSESLLK